MALHSRILVCGDSIARGIAFDEVKNRYAPLRESFVQLLSESLQAAVRNSARFGNTLIRGADRLKNDVQSWKPDVTLVEFGGNDCDFDWQAIARDPEGHHEPNTEFNRFQSMLLDLVKDIRQLGSEPVLLTLPPLDADRFLRWVSQAQPGMAERILSWMGTVTKIYWWQERYNSAVLDVARQTQSDWIDVRSAFLQSPDYTHLLCRDGIHPNELGHRVMARRVLDYFTSRYPGLLRTVSPNDLATVLLTAC